MKKFLLIAMCLVFVLALVACNKESAEQFVEWKGDQLENSQED